MSGAKNSLNESAEASSKAFDIPSNNLQLESKNSRNISVEALRQFFIVVCLFVRFENKGESFRDYITFKTRQKRGFEEY